ncbi:MAG: hypothetical protein LQ351_004176 [Letrouitia transgressa]|nr:MAG: hypothetical protein LQ351_004176 [Letrouitia transgressa]
MTVPPPTPPSTAPTSPSKPQSTNGDFIVNIPEKEQCNEKVPDDVNPPAAANRTIATTVKKYWQSAKAPSRHRKEDGRPKIIERIDDHPKGYPQFAAFMNCDDNFLMCRRFGFLHDRVLLYRQDELTQLERDLVEMDSLDAEEDPLSLQSRKRDDAREFELTRKGLIDKIDSKLKQYDELAQRIRATLTFPKPSTRNYNSFYKWINNQKPLSREETEFVQHGYDFVALAEKQEGGWFDGILEDVLSVLPRRITKSLLASEEQRKKSDDDYVHLYSKYRIDILARLILTIVSVVLLMAPTAVLFLTNGHGILKILIIMLFTLLFSAALSVFTKAKRHEMFAATAA